ncbi:hypothetical protein JOE23_001663 [Amphibacillus cookii]|nr:hypothetical protein [Amphibacillus cookii]
MQTLPQDVAVLVYDLILLLVEVNRTLASVIIHLNRFALL